MNKKVGQTAGGSDHQGTALSNIPGPKAPPKFNSIFLADSSSSQRYDLTSVAPSTTFNQSVNATPKSSIRSSSSQPTTQTFKVNAPPPPKTNTSPQSTNSQTRNSRLPVIIDENFTETDVNRLPRQNTVEEFISAIDDVTKRNDLIMDRTKDDNLREERDLETTTIAAISQKANDPDIDYLLKEVERREKRQRELDYKIKLNERRLSEKYRKMARDDLSTKRAASLVRSNSPEKSKRKSVTIAEEVDSSRPVDDTNRKIEENKLKRETLIRRLAGYDELETKKKQRLSEQEKELKLEESDKLIAEGASMLASSKTSDNDDCSQQPAKKRIAPRIEPKRETLVKIKNNFICLVFFFC